MLEVEDLRSGYGSIPIVQGVTLRVGAGEIVGVLGHNGMGKTTLLRTLIGELPATHGVIRLDGADITRFSMARRARLGLGYVPQGRGIFPDLTVRENLHVGARLGDGDRGVEEIVASFPILAPLLDRSGRALSGGEQQILALARCLVGRPRLMLLDEPSEGIQPSIVEQIIDHLRDFRQRWNLAILLVEQDLEVIAALASRILLMQKGQVASEISPAGLYDQGLVEEHLGL
jgi:ABC-type branched-subunit amino acid transport system ATPase component